MKIIIKTSFNRDVKKIKDKCIIFTLIQKIEQIEDAKSLENIAEIKLLRGYPTYYRIKVKADTKSYRIGAIVEMLQFAWFVFCQEIRFTRCSLDAIFIYKRFYMCYLCQNPN